MNKRKISLILATATMASMTSSFISKNVENNTKNEVLLSRTNKETKTDNIVLNSANKNQNSKSMNNQNINNEDISSKSVSMSNQGINDQNQKVASVGKPESSTGKSSNNNLLKNTITLTGNWGGDYRIANINFNTSTNKIEVNANMIAFFAQGSGKALRVSLYNASGQIIQSKVYMKSDRAREFYNDFNNLSFKYGDIIQITSLSNIETTVSNISGKGNYNTNQGIAMEITQNGLKKLDNNLKVNPVYYEINSNKLNISGRTEPSMPVSINVGNEVYNTKSNSEGFFSLNVVTKKDISPSINILVYAKGENIIETTPKINPNIYGIVKNNITLMGNWTGTRYKTDVISFNPVTKKIEVGGSMTAYFGSGSGSAFNVALYNKDGSVVKNKTYYLNNQAQNLYDDFNNLNFDYGDIIKISCLTNVETKVSNYNGNNEFITNKPLLMEITKDGLKPYSMDSVKINPFDVLGNGNVYSGVLTGVTNKPNQEVTVSVDGETFKGTSNSKGEFSIKISDSKGFIDTTKILVWANGELTTEITPVAIKNLGIAKSNILIHGEDGVISQKITFNPANMTIQKSAPWGNQFSVQLIDGESGKILAGCSTGNFNVSASKNNLNGATFKYGDIIAVYESKETNLSFGDPLLSNEGKQSHIDCSGEFQCYKITQQGLVAVPNKNLLTSKVLYTGSKNITITGKTVANSDVTVFFGDKSEVVKANDSGDFTAEVPLAEAPIGSEVRVFVNNDNNNIMIVNYDSSLFNINTNKIEVLNNEGVPVFNIEFNPIENKFKAIAYPMNKTYAGAFYGQNLNIKVINPVNGDIVYNFKGNKLNDISSFISQINNKVYNLNDIIEVSYNPNFVTANIYNGKESIGNTNGQNEYFKITDKGLVSLNNKFINVNPVNILGGSEVISANITGKANPNSLVEVSVDGKVFKGQANSSGEFSIPVTDKNGFNSNTNIVISSNGYIPTTVNPTISSKINLMNSYINFYNNAGWESVLISSVGFNPSTMKFVVNNYSNSFGNGSSKYFDLSLYNANGEKILSSSVNNGSTTQLSNLLNNKSFSYGDIIGLSYDNSISKPVILNGNNAIGNISGQEEYFEITKNGLVKVNFGQNAETTNVYFDGNNLVINSELETGQDEDIIKADKNLVILNSNNEVIASVNTSELNKNPLET